MEFSRVISQTSEVFFDFADWMNANSFADKTNDN